MSIVKAAFDNLRELAGIEAPENIDGISFLPTLLGEDGQKEHNYLYWEFHEQRGRHEGKLETVPL